MADPFANVRFTSDMALTAAQIIPVLGLAFVIEMRSLSIEAKKAWLEGRQALAAGVAIVAGCVLALLSFGASDASGLWAMGRWAVAVVGIGVTAWLLGLSLVTSLKVAERAHSEVERLAMAVPKKRWWVRK